MYKEHWKTFYFKIFIIYTSKIVFNSHTKYSDITNLFDHKFDILPKMLFKKKRSIFFFFVPIFLKVDSKRCKMFTNIYI